MKYLRLRILLSALAIAGIVIVGGLTLTLLGFLNGIGF